MANQPKLSVIVPAYNEQRRISKTLKSIVSYLQEKHWSFELIVVDDGSSDATKLVVRDLRLPSLSILSYGENRGKGYAVCFGARHAQGEWILFTDADNSTPIDQLEKLWPFSADYPVVIGSRYMTGSVIALKQPTPRVVLSRLGNLLVQLLILPGVRDSQCGFKLFQRSAARSIFPKQTIWRWGFDMEILRIAREHQLKIKEVPITWYNDTQSRIQSSRVFTRTLLELLTIKKNSLLHRYR
jgi:dolichyl-phosphate beta-glucosyltransferase